MALLEVTRLGVSYGAVQAVKDISFTVGHQEAVAVLGSNGAGKSSALRGISGIAARVGTVRFDGVDISRSTPQRIARAGLIHVPEGRRLFASLSVEENLEIGRRAAGRRRQTFGLPDVYRLFPTIEDLRGREAWSLSGGEQQMVAIGRALMAGPRLLMIDEPTLGLAPIIARDLVDTLRLIVDQTSLLVVEQNTTAVLYLCERGYVMAGGRIVHEGTSADLRESREVLDAYLGRVDDVANPEAPSRVP